MDKKIIRRATMLIGLVLTLSGCDSRTKSEAIEEWKAEGKSGKIIKLIYDPVQADRLEAITALGDMRAKDALQPLGGLFNDPDKVVVHEAINAVVVIGGPEIEPYMLKAITLDTVPARIAGATALGEFKSPEAVDALIVALDDYQYPDIVLAAVKSLGQIADPKSVEPLCATLQGRSDNIRAACIEALQEIGTEAAIKGIATRLADVNNVIRDAAVSALQASGSIAGPYALETLRDESYHARASALSVIDAVDAVPESGSDRVWYRFAQLTTDRKTVVDPQQVDDLAAIEDCIPALVEGLSHPTPAIREYAIIALEDSGEDAVEAVVAAAEDKATEKGRNWFSGRSGWIGAPSWRIDLWAAATAINPKFNINRVQAEWLAGDRAKAAKMMVSENFRPLREYIPSLLLQLRETEAVGEEQKKPGADARTMAVKHLEESGYQSVFPLVAALNGTDEEIAIQAARILNTMNDPRVQKFVVHDYMDLFGLLDPPAEEEPDATNAVASAEEPAEAVVDDVTGEADAEEEPVVESDSIVKFPGSPMHYAMLEFDIPELQELLVKIRPIDAQAIKALKEKHPDVTATNLPLPAEIEVPPDAVVFRLGYNNFGQKNELKVVYRRDVAGNWALARPIPDTLP
jgi:HEAT repeat protein